MTTILFDTHAAFKSLQEAGFDDAQANAMVAMVGTALSENVATKQDLVEIRSEMQAQGNNLECQ